MTTKKEAWEQFKEDNAKLFDSAMLVNADHAKYLENRLFLAWEAGIEVGIQMERERITRRIAERVLGV